MKICYFGDYVLDYPRHIVLMEGLTSAGAEAYTCQLEKIGIRRYLEIFSKVRKLSNDTDIILIAYSNARYVWFVRLLTKKPIVWNAFYSIYDNWVNDRKRVKKGSPKAGFVWFLDYICCAAAHRIILETNADIQYFHDTFRTPKHKFIRIFIGYNEHIFKPISVEKDKTIFNVEYHGTYIPVQGASCVIKAAKILRDRKDIRFTMIGGGQTYDEVRSFAESEQLTNVTFFPFIPREEIPNHIASADVCIGLVGNISRVNQAIPNKVLEAAAMVRPSINARTDAITELFTEGRDILLINRGDAADLAEKILMIKNDPELKETIAQNAHTVVMKKCSIAVLGRELHQALKTYCDEKNSIYGSNARLERT